MGFWSATEQELLVVSSQRPVAGKEVSERLSRTWGTHIPHQEEVGEALLELYAYRQVHLHGQQCGRIMRITSGNGV